MWRKRLLPVCIANFNDYLRTLMKNEISITLMTMESGRCFHSACRSLNGNGKRAEWDERAIALFSSSTGSHSTEPHLVNFSYPIYQWYIVFIMYVLRTWPFLFHTNTDIEYRHHFRFLYFKSHEQYTVLHTQMPYVRLWVFSMLFLIYIQLYIYSVFL